MIKRLVYILYVIPLYITCCGFTNNQIADAIYKAEASQAHPYGIRSIDTHHNEQYARKICLNSIRNAKARWAKAGSPGDFIAFMGLRYSPPAINPNWVRLVHWFLNQAQNNAYKTPGRLENGQQNAFKRKK